MNFAYPDWGQNGILKRNDEIRPEEKDSNAPYDDITAAAVIEI